jgi:Tfp pilus assembly protein PilF
MTLRGRCRLWKVGSWEEGPLLKGVNFTFTPDGKMLAVAESPGVVVLWSCDAWRELARLEAPISDRMGSPCFTPDGSRLFYHVGDTIPSIRAWDLRRIRRQLKELDLDWDWPDFPEAPPLPPLKVQVDAGDLVCSTKAGQLARSARAAWRTNDHAQALRLLRQAVQAYPDHATAHEALAWYLLTGPTPIRHPPTALRHAQRAVELQGDRAAFLNTLGVAHYRNGHYPRALRVLQQSLVASNRQNDGFDLYFLAMCHARLGDRVKGKGCFERAVQWVGEYKSLSVEAAAELKQFRDEAERVLAGKAFLEK